MGEWTLNGAQEINFEDISLDCYQVYNYTYIIIGLVPERMSHQYFLKNPVNSVARLPNPRFTKNA